MKHNKKLLIFSLAALVLFACNLPGAIQQSSRIESTTPAVQNTAQPTIPPTPTTDPSIAEGACLAGTWEINDLSVYVLAAIPQDMVKQYNLQYKGASGKAYFILSPDGGLKMQADQLEMVFEAQASILKVQVTASVDGEAVGKYSVKDHTLTTSGVDTSGLKASAQAFGSDLVDPSQIINAIPLIQPPFNTAEFSCTGDTLQLKIASYPEGIPPLVFHRAK